MPARFRLVLVVVLAFLLAWLMAPRTAGAQLAGAWIVLDDAGSGFLQISHNPWLSPSAAFPLVGRAPLRATHSSSILYTTAEW